MIKTTGIQLSELLNNYIIYLPELYLALSIILLLGYGVIFSKKGGIVGLLNKITNLSIITLISTLYLEYVIWINNNNLLIINNNINEGLNISQFTNNNIISGSLGIDSLTLLIKIIIIISGIIVLILSKDIYKNKLEKIIDYEYSQLILLSILGMLLLVSSRDLIIMYLSIETLSLSLYILASIRKTGQLSTEGGLKYFILGALSSGLLLFGCALIYITTGLLDFISISNYIDLSNSLNIINNNIGIEIGVSFIIFAILFKLAAAPFHMWAPDVYEGSPTIVTTYFATVPKISILLLLINLIYGPFIGVFSTIIKPLLLISGLLSIIIGSLGALNQTKVKRLLAYSAIGHIGFIILGLVPGTINSLQASIIYIILYIIMSFNTFSFILIYYNKYKNINITTDGLGTNYIIQLSGLSRKEPVLAATFTISLLSIAGIPPLAGFFSKYYILLTLVDHSLYLVSIIAVIFSVIACFYYIRIIQFMYFKNNSTFSIKDLADISYNNYGNTSYNNISSTSINKYNYNNNNDYSLSTIIIMGITLFIILTFIFYPSPLLIIVFDSIINTFI